MLAFCGAFLVLTASLSVDPPRVANCSLTLWRDNGIKPDVRLETTVLKLDAAVNSSVETSGAPPYRLQMDQAEHFTTNVFQFNRD